MYCFCNSEALNRQGSNILKKLIQQITVQIMVIAAIGLCSAAETNQNGAAGTTITNAKGTVQQIIFTEQKIEGKIRRPQLVLIQADQRPHFSPMVMQMFNKSTNAAELVDPGALDMIPNHEAFQFEGTKIVGMKP
jgi:hypothetical protein